LYRNKLNMASVGISAVAERKTTESTKALSDARALLGTALARCKKLERRLSSVVSAALRSMLTDQRTGP
jgi:hypothetical protein